MTKKTRRLISNLLISNLFCTISAGSLCAQHFHRVSIEEVLSIGSDENEELYQWAGLSTDATGNVYISDIMDYSIKKFDTHGHLIKKTGRKGRGFGEFMAIRLVSFYDNLIYVTDQGNPGIHVFDRDLNYKYHINYSLPIVDLKILAHNQIVISSALMQNRGQLVVVDSLGKKQYEIPYSRDEKKAMMNAVCFEFDKNHNIYLNFMFEDVIKKVDREGEELWKIGMYGGKKSEIKNIKGMKLPKNVVYKDIALDTARNVFVLGGSFAKHKSRDIYVLTREGKHITTFTLPEPTHCIHIDDYNYLYARAAMGTILKKYRIIYEYGLNEQN